MILFFRTPTKSVIATEVSQELASEDIQKLSWLYGEATVENEENQIGRASCRERVFRAV